MALVKRRQKWYSIVEHANALLRGTLVVADSKHVGNYWQATVHASFELVGLESSEVNSFDDYFTAVDTDEKKAFERAREKEWKNNNRRRL